MASYVQYGSCKEVNTTSDRRKYFRFAKNLDLCTNCSHARTIRPVTDLAITCKYLFWPPHVTFTEKERGQSVVNKTHLYCQDQVSNSFHLLMNCL